MFKERDIAEFHRNSIASRRRAGPEMKILTANDPDLKLFKKLPPDYQSFIIEKVQALKGAPVNDKRAAVKYFLRKYEEFQRLSGQVESRPGPVDSEQAKLQGELSAVAAEVDNWFSALTQRHESGRQSSPNRVM